MWARFRYSQPAEMARPAAFVPPPPQYVPPEEPSAFARLYDVVDRAKAALVTITGGPTTVHGVVVISSGHGQRARRAVTEIITTAPASDPAPAAPQTGSPSFLNSVAVKVAAGVVGLVLGLCVLALWIRRWRRRRRRQQAQPLPLPPPMLYNPNPYYKGDQPPLPFVFMQQHHHHPTAPQTSGGTFSDAGSERPHSISIDGGSLSYDQLAAATGGFSPDNVIGQGGFGCVYRGRLQDGTEVAIKKLKTESKQGDREFRAEADIITRVHHRNLVSLVGYCISGNDRLLVYEFVPNKTLDTHLHGDKWPPLDWQQRWKIAVGSARGLAYLHDDCSPKIIHRDVKASNILLDHGFEPKVADFGLAKYQPGNHTHVSTRIMGTFGYIAPEFLSSGKLTDKADVFAFGVVLLELITGRLPVQSSESYMDSTLVGWAKPLISEAMEEGNFDILVDPDIGDDYDENKMMRMMECAAAAVRQSAHLRPSMVQILKHLQGQTHGEDLNSIFRTTYAEDTYSSIMESGESIGPRSRRAPGSQGNTSSDYSSDRPSSYRQSQPKPR
ncbi:proline-rich receptor-like protein kinase PERK15 [Oryza sativa Japonica Group]|uniref:non-specific serine/threonine protein kinase n=1 Tax=Oryza sativa subsp. japonica TaxID=39947 RepID=A0A0N7KHK5_ORYSJ|nr:Os03g0583600 [Oryza sativa Japonica Group]